MCSVWQDWARLNHHHRFGCWTGRGLFRFPIPSKVHRLNVLFAFPCSQLGSSAGSAPSSGEGGEPSTHRDPQPGQQQSLAASNGNNCSLARAIPVESLAALVLPRLFFHAIISSLSDPLPARWPPGTAVAHLAGGDSQGMEMGEVPVSALQGQT